MSFNEKYYISREDFVIKLINIYPINDVNVELTYFLKKIITEESFDVLVREKIFTYYDALFPILYGVISDKIKMKTQTLKLLIEFLMNTLMNNENTTSRISSSMLLNKIFFSYSEYEDIVQILSSFSNDYFLGAEINSTNFPIFTELFPLLDYPDDADFMQFLYFLIGSLTNTTNTNKEITCNGKSYNLLGFIYLTINHIVYIEDVCCTFSDHVPFSSLLRLLVENCTYDIQDIDYFTSIIEFNILDDDGGGFVYDKSCIHRSEFLPFIRLLYYEDDILKDINYILSNELLTEPFLYVMAYLSDTDYSISYEFMNAISFPSDFLCQSWYIIIKENKKMFTDDNVYDILKQYEYGGSNFNIVLSFALCVTNVTHSVTIMCMLLCLMFQLTDLYKTSQVDILLKQISILIQKIIESNATEDELYILKNCLLLGLDKIDSFMSVFPSVFFYIDIFRSFFIYVEFQKYGIIHLERVISHSLQGLETCFFGLELFGSLIGNVNEYSISLSESLLSEFLNTMTNIHSILSNYSDDEQHYMILEGYREIETISQILDFYITTKNGDKIEQLFYEFLDFIFKYDLYKTFSNTFMKLLIYSKSSKSMLEKCIRYHETNPKDAKLTSFILSSFGIYLLIDRDKAISDIDVNYMINFSLYELPNIISLQDRVFASLIPSVLSNKRLNNQIKSIMNEYACEDISLSIFKRDTFISSTQLWEISKSDFITLYLE